MEKKENKKTIEVNFKIDKSKLFKGIGVFVAVLAILGLSFVASKTYGNKIDYEFIDITVDEYLEKMKSSEKQIIYVARPNCSYCQKEFPIIRKVGSKYDLEIFYLNTIDFFDEEKNDYTENGYKFLNSAEVYKNGFGTPNTIIVQDGKIVDGIYQYVEASELEDLFRRNGFINE